MSTPPRLIDLSLRVFADKLAEKSATPGGGSMAACLAAAGAGLVAMALRFSSGPKYAQVEVYLQGRAEELDQLRAQALELVDKDSAAYDAVSAAYKLPKSTPEEQTARGAAIQKALKGALELPLETMETALAAMRLAAVSAADTNQNLASDLCTGALCLWAGLEGAWCNVAVNSGGIEDKSWLGPRSRAAEALREEASRLLGEMRARFQSQVDA